jgi:hypothetical protein
MLAHGEAHHAGPPGNDGVYYERLREGAVARTVSVRDDAALVDVDSDGFVLGVEVLDGGDWRDALANLARAGRRSPGRAVPDGRLLPAHGEP